MKFTEWMENEIIKMIKRSHAFVTKCHAQRHHMLVAESRHYLVIDLPTLGRFRFRCVSEPSERARGP